MATTKTSGAMCRGIGSLNLNSRMGLMSAPGGVAIILTCYQISSTNLTLAARTGRAVRIRAAWTFIHLQIILVANTSGMRGTRQITACTELTYRVLYLSLAIKHRRVLQPCSSPFLGASLNKIALLYFTIKKPLTATTSDTPACLSTFPFLKIYTCGIMPPSLTKPGPWSTA